MVNVKDVAEYMVAFVNEFGQRHGLSNAQAFRYLWRYHAITNISNCYEAAHTLTFDDVCQTATDICHSRGGELI